MPATAPTVCGRSGRPRPKLAHEASGVEAGGSSGPGPASGACGTAQLHADSESSTPLTSSRPSGGPAFVNGHAKRTLQETDEWQVVAMQTKFGPAVALFYKDPKRKKEGIFANIQPAQLDVITYEEARPILDAKQQADANGTAKQGHHVGTTADGVDVYAKGGPYGNYLTWTDAAGSTAAAAVSTTDNMI